MTLTENTPLFKNISKQTLNLVQSLNEQQVGSFLIPTRFISPENAQLAYMLSEYYNQGRDESSRKIYRSFFVNSRFEALQGAIKLMRHNGFMTNKNQILILDTEEEIKFLVNPLGEPAALIPGITIISNFAEFEGCLKQYDSIIGVIIRNTKAGLPVSDCSSVIEKCKNEKIIVLWDDPDHQFEKASLLSELSSLPDMVILGESLTGYEIPFALFSMTAEIHRPWATTGTCLLHSSTYSGNKLAVIKARDTLLAGSPFFKDNSTVRDILNRIVGSTQETLNYYANYINPGMIKFYSLIGFDFICKKSHGSWLEIQYQNNESQQVLDAVSGGGAAIRGHSPQEIVSEVVLKHQENVDYWTKLKERLQELFSFPHAFPAISGATAVENVFILTRLACQNKKRIIVFKNNFAGNTLVSFIGTGNEAIHSLFKPLYKLVTFFDPFQPDAGVKLLNELEKGDVGLIWFEIFQGSNQADTETRIPEHILEVVQNNKQKWGYYIGIDEILMGFYRTGKLASFHDTPVKPDVITFSKALADGTFPMAATLVSDDIYNKARDKNPEIVALLEKLYINQFGAHIALNSINNLVNPLVVEQIERAGRVLEKGMMDLKKRFSLIREIRGKGHFYQISYKNSLLSMYFCKRALQNENLFIFLDRVIPAVTISEKDAEELVKRLNNLYAGIGNQFIFNIKSIFIAKKIIKSFKG